MEFFATSHGKGGLDGVAGSVKRAVWTAVSARKVTGVVSAEEFLTLLESSVSLLMSVSV